MDITLANIKVGDELVCEGQGMADELIVTVTKVTAYRIHAGGMIFDKDGHQVSSRPAVFHRHLHPMPEKSPA